MAAGSGAYQPLFFGATNRAGVAVSTLVAVGSIPIFAGLNGWLFMRARPTLFWLFSTITAIAGLLFLSWKDLSVNDSIGLIMALGAGFCSGCYIVAAKIELNRGEGFLELPVAAYLLGSLMLSPMLVTQPLGWVVTPSGFLMSLYLGVVTMALANVFQVRGIRGLAPGPAATLSLADPLTATILGLVVLGESISAVGALGLVLLFGALATQGAVIRNNR
jgi:DME family drug/metabolite transporter